MRKSKMFLIAGSFVLAIAAVVGTQANKRLVTYYYFNPSTTTCVALTAEALPCPDNGAVACTVPGSPNPYQTYITRTAGTCINPIQYLP